MRLLLFIFLCLSIFSCDNGKDSPLPSSQKHIDSLQEGTAVVIKFNRPISYEKFRADTFAGKFATVDYNSDPSAKRFRSAIKWSVEKFGVNFGGHYNLATWGCGTACKSGALTDLISGAVYSLPSAELDYDFRKDSRLLVINPPDSAGYHENCEYCEPRLFVWNEKKRIFEKAE